MLAKILISTFLLLQLNSGCVSKELVALSIDIASVQTETTDSLTSAIKVDMANLTDPVQIQKAQSLIDRLDYLKRGNIALSKGLTKDMNPKDLAGLIKEYSSIKETQ